MAEIVRFVVESAFELSGRGTVVVGRLEEGTIRAGDKLRLLSQGAERTVTCRGAAAIRESDWTPGTPPPIGLLLPELSPDEVSPEDVLVAG